MRFQPRSWTLSSFLLLAFSLTSIPPAIAQQTAPANPKSTNSKPLASSAQAQPKEPVASVDSSQSEGEGPEYLRRRAEWFYRQRASVKGRIPGGAYQRAFQHLQKMLVAEGRLTQNPDGSFTAVAAPPLLSSLAVTSIWKSLGPAPATGGEFSPVTGRVMTIAIDPSDSTGNTVLLGGAMGGIWRSTDAGATWTSVGDQNASLAMGSIAFAPSNPATVYAGTGEFSLGFDTYYGAGVLKSTDHGKTWTQTCTVASASCPFIGPYLDATNPGFGFLNFGGAHISYISVNPTNPNLVLVAVQLIEEGPKEGVYCSDNGGNTWSNVLADEEASFVGFASSTVAYAAFGNIFGSSQGAPNGNGIYKATTIGATCATVHFSRLTSATLPTQASMGRIDLGIAPSDQTGNTVYASIADAGSNSDLNLGVFLTTNGGTSWIKTTAPDVCQHQCWYDNVVKVDPTQPGTAFLAGGAVADGSGNPAWVVRTTNNGTSWSSVIPNIPAGSAALPHVDNHALAMFKLQNGKVRLYLGNDGGIWRTDDAEAASVQWTNLNNPSLSITQFYPAVSVPVSNPNAAFGGTQDNGSLIYQGGVSWVDSQLCGDGGFTAVDNQIPSTIYVGCVTGAPVNVSVQNGALGTFSPASSGINPADNSSFVPPLATDPNTPNVLYFGTVKVYQSLDAGTTWNVISPDLVGGNNWLTALTVAPGNPNILYAGSNTNAGFTFTNISVTNTNFVGASFWNQSGIPPRQINSIGADPSDATGMTAYVAFSGFSFVGNDPFGNAVNDPLGHIFKTTNGGQSWSDVSCSVANCSTPAAKDLPNVPVNDVLVDPNLPNTLYAATDLGVFIGDCSTSPCSWTTLGTGLPRVAVLSLRVHAASRTLLAGTHGRGAWTIDLNNFTFSGPHISSISPVSANSGSATFTLTVNGSGLTGGTIQWNGSTTGVTTTQVSDSQLTASVAASLVAVAGVPKITAQVASQASNSLPFSVLAATPTLTSVTPSSTPVQTPNPSTNITVKFIGTGFSSLAKILWNGAPSGATVAAPTASCPLPTCLTASLPASLLGPFGSTNDISVLNTPPGGGQSKPLTFKVVAPPPPNDNFANAIIITTLSLVDLQDSSGATTESSDPVPSCATQFTAAQGNTGGHPNGAYNTIWYKFTPQFSANLSLDLSNSSYDTVLSVWQGTQGNLTQVACNDDINPGIVIQSQLQSVPLTAGTTYYIMVSSFGPPDANPVALGGRSFLIFNYNGGEFPTPTITSMSPTSANSGDQGATFTVNGSNFLSGATVLIVTSEDFTPQPQPTKFISSSQLTASVPASAIALPGPGTLFVQNPQPSIGSSNTLSFTVNVGTYPVPKLNGISPASVIATTPGTVIDAGGDFFASNAVLNFNGVAEQTTVNNPTSLTAIIPASQIGVANVGTIQVTVSNPSPGGGPSTSIPFTVTLPNPIPTITSINPSSVPANPSNPPTVTVSGSNFQQGAALFFFSSASNNFVQTATFVSATQLTFVPLGYVLNSPASYSVSVVDPPPGGYSNSVNFAVVAPDFTLTASGTISQTVNAGATATYTNVLTVSPQNGFASTVNLSCSVIATATHCSVNPTSLTNGSATVAVTTTARALMPPIFRTPRPYWPLPVYLFLIAAVLAAILLALRARRFRLAFAIPFAALALLFVLHSAGCGGGSYSPPPPPPPTGTAAGTYTINVTATSGTLTHTTTLTLVVN
ncbi:MAG: hypothetical protein JSS69_05885 [Acidobacteria bacterium]|nr:hypothetical protein [Acidobacteriota bacterium]MBS1865431.1 hypothetical protein [Acidobacteriota bacterium]